jgi:MIP family channel proteins
MRAKMSPAGGIAEKLLAEAAGTFFVTLAAVGVDVLYYRGDQVDFVSRWLARGFVTSALIYALSEISGAHVNPAVSIGFALRNAMRWPLAASYVAAQFAGAFAASALAWARYGADAALGASRLGPGVPEFVGVAAELVMSFFVVAVILFTADEEAKVGKQAALAVGLAIAACGFFGGPISGASMNPARSLASQVLAGRFDEMWIYAVGPLAGAVVAALACRAVLGTADERDRRVATGKQRRQQ